MAKLNMLTKVASLIIASVLLSASFSIQSCPIDQMADIKTDSTEKTCCCCQNTSLEFQNPNRAEHNCPCQVSERKPEDRSSAVIVSNYDIRSDVIISTLGKATVQENQLTLIKFLSYHFFKLSSRDRPLYILKSSFLI